MNHRFQRHQPAGRRPCGSARLSARGTVGRTRATTYANAWLEGSLGTGLLHLPARLDATGSTVPLRALPSTNPERPALPEHARANRAGNRVWRHNVAAGTGQDEFYTYDGLYQIKTLDRGTLNGTFPNFTGIGGTPSWEEDWNYDETGNWRGASTGYLTKVNGTTTLNQNRTHNVANEITDITESTGTAWTTPVQDANGNMTQFPQPLSLGSGYTVKYDAWNRLVQVNNTTGGALVATYRYDGFHRRVTSLLGSDTRHYYYSRWWQVLEERLNAGTTAERAYVWGLRYLDDLVLRQKSSERLYALHDYYSVTAIVNTSGTVLERYGYDGFGTPRFMNASFGSASSSYGWETLYGAYRYDANTGLYQVRFRYQHPKLGRWEKRDPVEEFGGINLYNYVGNNSVNSVDPQGLYIGEIPPAQPQPPGNPSGRDCDKEYQDCVNAVNDTYNDLVEIMDDHFNNVEEWIDEKEAWCTAEFQKRNDGSVHPDMHRRSADNVCGFAARISRLGALGAEASARLAAWKARAVGLSGCAQARAICKNGPPPPGIAPL